MHIYKIVVEQVVRQRKVVRVHLNEADKDEAIAIAESKATETEDGWETMDCETPEVITVDKEK